MTRGTSATAGPTILNPPDNPFFVNVPANVNIIPELPQRPASPSLSSSADEEQFPSPSNSSHSVATPGHHPTRGPSRTGPHSTFRNLSRIRRVGKKNDVRANDVWTFYKEHSGRHECVFCL